MEHFKYITISYFVQCYAISQYYFYSLTLFGNFKQMEEIR